MFREIIVNDFYTIMLIIGLVVVALAKLTEPRRFNDFISVIVNSKYLKVYARDQKFFDQFDVLLFVNFIVSLSLFVFISYKFFYNLSSISTDVMFKITLGICMFVLIKVIVERLIGSLFEIQTIIDHYLFQKISYKNYLGIVLIPINALLLFSFSPTLTFFYIIVILLFVIIVIGLFTSIKAHQTSIKYNFFYFILYLCALEIVPCIVLYKLLISK